MKLFLLAVFPLLLYSFQLGKVSGNPFPDVVKEEVGARSSLEEPQGQKPVQDLSWISLYNPVKSCHTDLTEKYGEFSPPSFPNGFQGNIWCNWTIWAGSRKHIVIYIKGFQSSESCDVNGDKIFFHGVSSLAENAVIYACWQKEVHVFATYGQGVHVVLLLRQTAHLRKERLLGKYYIFKHHKMRLPPKGIIGSSEILTPELSRSVLTSLPLSGKEPFLLMWDSMNTSLSASHRTDQVTELSESSPARGKDLRIVDPPSFVRQVTGTDYLTLTNPSLLSVSSIHRKFPYSPEMLIETRRRTSWGHLTQSNTPPDVPSYIPHPSSSLITISSPTQEPALPTTRLWPFIMNDPHVVSRMAQLDYLAWATHSLPESHTLEAITELNQGAIHSQSVKEGISTHFPKSVKLLEGSSRDAPVFETDVLPSPEQNWNRIQEDSFLVPSETPVRGKPDSSGSSALLFSDDYYMTEWESKTVPVPEESTMLLDTRPFLESGVEVTDLLSSSLGITVPSSSPYRRLYLNTESSYPESFNAIGNISPVATELITSADISLNLATEMLGESQKSNWVGQSSHFVDRTMKPELSFFLDESTVATVVSTEPEFSIFSQDHAQSFGIRPILPFSAVALKSSHTHSSEAILLLAIPDQETTPSAVDPDLSPSMSLTDPLHYVEPDQTLSLPELDSLVLSETEPVLSLERLGPHPLRLEGACSETAAIWEPASELENVLSSSAGHLELSGSPTTIVNFPATEQTPSFFSPVNEITPSLRLLTANGAKTVSYLTSCRQYAASASEQEDPSLLTVQSSGSVDPTVGVLIHSVSAALAATELEHLLPTTGTAFTKQPLTEGKGDDSSVTLPEEEDEGFLFTDTVKDLNSLSKTEQFPSLVGFTANGQSPQDESVTKTPLAFVPVAGKKTSVMNHAFISSMALTSVLRTEMHIQAVFPSPLQSVDDVAGLTVWPQEMQPSAEWQRSTPEDTTSSVNILRTFSKTLSQKNTTDLKSPQPPSDAENKMVSQVPWNDIELGFPWLMVYLPVQSCHITLKDEAGMFSPPTFSNAQANNWCNWTIWAGPEKHILIYIEGFEGKPNCEENQDKILFQGVMSSMENKVAHACRNQGTLIFATQAEAAHVVFLSKAASQNHGPKQFKGQYYIFEDYEVSPSADGDIVLEEPVLKSNSQTGLPSYIIHSRRISDFEKMNRVPSHENHLSVNSKERRNGTNHASNLEALLRPAVSNYTPLSFSKSAKNVIDMKERQVIKPFADEYQIGTDILPGSLKKTAVLSSNGFADEEKAIIPSESQKFRMKSKLVATGITTESVGIENDGHVPIRWRSPYVKDAGRAKFERSGFLSGVTFPQASLKVQKPPISPLRIIPEEDPYQVLQPRHSHSEISKKASNAVEFQHVEMEEGKRLDGQVIREGDGNRHVAAANGGRRNESHGTELLAVNKPDKPAMKTKPHLTTLAQLNVLNVFSSLDVPNSDLMGFGPTSHPEVVLPGLIKMSLFWNPSTDPEVQERVKLVSNKVKELKLKEVKRKARSERKKMNDPNLIFTFWLHLEPDEKNISRLIHSQLEGLRGTSTRSGKIQQVSVGDVNECSSGTELCGDAAICLNIYSTYFCECKEEYEDQSLTKSGTLCVRIPPSGLRFLYSYMEIFVGAMVFFIAVIVVVIVVLCTIVKKKRTKKDFSVPGVALSRTLAVSRMQPVAFDQSNIDTLLSLDPACLKLRAKQPEWPLQLASTPTEVCRVSIEQSECL